MHRNYKKNTNTLTGRIVSHVVESTDTEAAALDSLEKLLGNNHVCIDILDRHLRRDANVPVENFVRVRGRARLGGAGGRGSGGVR